MMKNILYNKITKWVIAAVCFLLIGSMLFTSYEMFAIYSKYCKERDEIENSIGQIKVQEEEKIDALLDEVFLYILETYATSGIDGIRQIYNGKIDDYKDVLGAEAAELLSKSNILIADAEQVYSNFVYVETLDFMEGRDVVELYHAMRRNGQLQYKTNVSIKEYSDHRFERCIRYGVVFDCWEDNIMDGNERLNTILQSMDYELLTFRLFSTSEFTEWLNKEVDEELESEKKVINSTYKKDIKDMGINLIIQAVCLVVSLLVLAILYGKSVEGLTQLNKWERKPVELHILMLAVLSAPIIMLAMYIYEHLYWYWGEMWWIKPLLNQGIRWAYIILGTVVVSAIFYEIGILIKKRKNKRILKDCAILQLITKIVKGIGRFLKKVYDSTGYDALPDIKKKYIRKIIMDVVVAVVTIVVTIIALQQYGALIAADKYLSWEVEYWYERDYGYHGVQIPLFLFMLVAVVIYYINSFKEYFDLRKYNKVAKAIETIYNGNYNSFTVEDSEKNDALKMLAHLSDNFEESVRKQVEAEKMQIELVANVSHDLKTPLTSIISYVELLKEEEMSDVAKDYVKVLSDKSDRLKYIVADVFDLAKATSGEQVPMEELDGVVLINQVLSDMQDKIETSGRDLRSKVVPETAPLTGNGQKLYRVFQNIIDNALKYSMPGTRIYLTADMEGAEFVVTLKNVSEYEMDFTAEEIMSRFTRGDKARHSEGNGLGLSIAKSFTELMGGSFTVEIDDDVFKTVVRLR